MSYALVLSVMMLVLSFMIPPFAPVQNDEVTYARHNSDSFANQLMWMGQDDGE